MRAYKTATSSLGGVWPGPSVDEKRKRLAEFEITEVWPQMGVIGGEEGWRTEDEIREYFQDLPDWEVQAVFAETFSHPGEDEFSEAFPDGWTCRDCGKQYELNHLPPIFPDTTQDGTQCPQGAGCKEVQA